MDIEIKCPKCGTVFKKNIDDISEISKSTLSDNEIEKIKKEEQEKISALQSQLEEEQIGRRKDRKKYQTELIKNQKSVRTSIDKINKSSDTTKGKIAEELLEEYLNNKFPLHKTEPIKSGQSGADIIMKISENNELMGSIYFESKKDYPNFQKNWVTKLKNDMLNDKVDFGIIITSVLPASHKSDEPYMIFEDGLIYAVKRKEEQNIYSIVDRLIERISRQFKINKTEENRMHNLSEIEKEAAKFIKTKNPKYLKELDKEIKNSESDLETIKRSNKKNEKLLEQQITSKRDIFNDFYEDLLEVGVDALED